MKQTDWIVIGVAAVLALGAAGAFYGTRPQPVTPPAPTAINTKDAIPEGGDVKLATALPGGGGNAGGAGAGGGMGRMGGPAGAPGGGAPPRSGGAGGGKNGWSLSASGN